MGKYYSQYSQSVPAALFVTLYQYNGDDFRPVGGVGPMGCQSFGVNVCHLG